MVFFSTFSTAIVGIMWGVHEYERFESESVRLKSEYIEQQRRLIKNEVRRAVDQVNYTRRQTEEHLKKSIRSRVHEAHAVATNLHRQFHRTRTDDEMKRMVVEALRDIRYNGGRGYFFATDFQGIERLFADRPELEGKDLLQMRDTRGQYVIRDMIDIAKNQGEGYYRYLWTKPGAEGNSHLKIAYVRHFEPFDWFIGTGEYFDDVKEELQLEMLHRLASTRFGADGYLFGSTYGGEPLFTGGRVTRGTESIWELTDPNGVRIIQEQRKVVKNPEGGFYEYAWPKPGSTVPSPKLSFSMGIDEWNWMIGAGVYTDVIDEAISSKKEKLHVQIRKQIFELAAVLLIMFVGIIAITLYVSSRVHRTFERFFGFFAKASSDYAQIDTSDMMFLEFKRIAELANKVIAERETAKASLSESESLLRKIAAHYPSYLSIIDEDFTVSFSSGKEFTRRNMDPASFNGVHIEEIFGEQAGFVREQYRTAFEGKEVRFELEYDGEFQEYTVIPFTSEDGRIRRLLAVVDNITERRRWEEQIKANLREKETLLHEIHHRVKNNMQIIASLLRLQLHSREKKDVDGILRETIGRVNAMAAIHENLHQSDRLSDIDFKSYLHKLTRMLSQTYGIDAGRVTFRIDCPELRVKIDTANPLGLVLNELISNSLKYAFPEERKGTITIRSTAQADGQLQVVVSDDGVGLPADLDWKTADTLGLRIVREIVENQLGGTIRCELQNGSAFTITCSLAATGSS